MNPFEAKPALPNNTLLYLRNYELQGATLQRKLINSPQKRLFRVITTDNPQNPNDPEIIDNNPCNYFVDTAVCIGKNTYYYCHSRWLSSSPKLKTWFAEEMRKNVSFKQESVQETAPQPFLILNLFPRFDTLACKQLLSAIFDGDFMNLNGGNGNLAPLKEITSIEPNLNKVPGIANMIKNFAFEFVHRLFWKHTNDTLGWGRDKNNNNFRNNNNNHHHHHNTQRNRNSTNRNQNNAVQQRNNNKNSNFRNKKPQKLRLELGNKKKSGGVGKFRGDNNGKNRNFGRKNNRF